MVDMDTEERMCDAIRSALRAGVNRWHCENDPAILVRLCNESRGYAYHLSGLLAQIEPLLNRSFGDAVEHLAYNGRGVDSNQLTKIAEESFVVSQFTIDEIFATIKKWKKKINVRRICNSLSNIKPEIYETTDDLFSDIDTLRQLDVDRDVEPGFFKVCHGIKDLGETHKPIELVKDLLFEETFAIIGGDPKAGKTTLAVQIALCVATGLPFFGHVPSKTGPVILIQADMGESHFKHVVSELSRGINSEEYKHPIYYHCSTGIDLAESKTRKKILDEIRVLNPVLIVADPLRDLHSGNENSSDEIKPILDFFLQLRDTTKATVIAIDHLTKPQEASNGSKKPAGYGLRGSGAKYGRADSVLIVRDQGMGLSQVEIIHRYGAPQAPVLYTREMMEVGFRLVQACHLEIPGNDTGTARSKILAFLTNKPGWFSRNSIILGARVNKATGLEELKLLEEQELVEHDGEPANIRKWKLKAKKQETA